jgi:hypothetical protein
VYRAAPPEKPPERPLEICISPARPLIALLVMPWSVPLWFVGRNVIVLFIAVIATVVPFAVFVVPALTSRVVRVDARRVAMMIDTRFLGIRVRTTSVEVARVRDVTVGENESEDGSSILVHLELDDHERVQLAFVEGNAVTIGEIRAAARALRDYILREG